MKPMLATPHPPFDDADWGFEIKYDGSSRLAAAGA